MANEPEKHGRDYCLAQPNLMVAAVWQEAMIHFQSREDQIAFVNAYIVERRRMDENRPEEKPSENSSH